MTQKKNFPIDILRGEMIESTWILINRLWRLKFFKCVTVLEENKMLNKVNSTWLLNTRISISTAIVCCSIHNPRRHIAAVTLDLILSRSPTSLLPNELLHEIEKKLASKHRNAGRLELSSKQGLKVNAERISRIVIKVWKIRSFLKLFFRTNFKLWFSLQLKQKRISNSLKTAPPRLNWIA